MFLLMIALLIEKRSPPLMKVKKNAPHRIFKVCVLVGNGSRVVVTHQIFLLKFSANFITKFIVFLQDG